MPNAETITALVRIAESPIGPWLVAVLVAVLAGLLIYRMGDRQVQAMAGQVKVMESLAASQGHQTESARSVAMSLERISTAVLAHDEKEERRHGETLRAINDR